MSPDSVLMLKEVSHRPQLKQGLSVLGGGNIGDKAARGLLCMNHSAWANTSH